MVNGDLEHPDQADAKADAVCPYCQSKATHLVSSTDHNRKTSTVRFDYYRCSQCGLSFMDAPPAEMSPYYEGGYDVIPSSYEALRSLAQSERYRTEPVLQYKKKGHFLEIGPWRGVICANMKDAGFDVTAIEMNSECVRFLREHVGIHAIESSDPAAAMKNLSPGFDVITAWHSLEHLPHPWLVIEEAARLLNPGGVLQLAMPNPESYEFSLMGERWMHLDAPRHLFFYSLDALVQLCKEHGLQPLHLTTSDRFSSIQSRHAWRSWVRRWIRVRYVRELIGDLAYRVAHKKQMTEGLGSAYTALFVRR